MCHLRVAKQYCLCHITGMGQLKWGRIESITSIIYTTTILCNTVPITFKYSILTVEILIVSRDVHPPLSKVQKKPSEDKRVELWGRTQRQTTKSRIATLLTDPSGVIYFIFAINVEIRFNIVDPAGKCLRMENQDLQKSYIFLTDKKLYK